MITVHITDDHKMLAEGLSALINESKIAIVTGMSYSLEACRNALAFQRPDILLLDIQLSDGSGVDFCCRMKKNYPDLKILALSMHNEYSIVTRMMKNGANGYIFKNTIFEEILKGIEAVMDGETFLCKDAEVLLKKQSNKNIYPTLTERSILHLIAEGYKSKEIANQLSLSVATISSYRKNLILKFGMRMTAIITMAIKKRWI